MGGKGMHFLIFFLHAVSHTAGLNCKEKRAHKDKNFRKKRSSFRPDTGSFYLTENNQMKVQSYVAKIKM